MAKFYGKIGFATTEETRPGIYEESIIERPYYGDVLRSSRSMNPSEYLNPNINISNIISIVANPYARNHIFTMRYVTFQGHKWRISNAEIKERRIELTIGGLWNEE